MIKIALAGGGTLGSVSPLLALQEALPEAEYIFIGTKHGIEYSLVRRAGIPYVAIPLVKLRRYTSIRNIIDILKFPVSVFASLRILIAERPSLVITAGSFVAVPVSLAARMLRIPVILHHQDIQIGLANRIVKHIASLITITFPHQQKEFPADKTVVTGNPVRALIHHDPTLERNEILILGGSQGASQLNRELNAIIPDLATRYQITHVLGKYNYHERLQLPTNYTALNFLERDISKHLSRAAIVITRGGLSTLTELAICKRPTIIIPLPGSHQEINAAFFESQNAARVVSQQDIANLPHILDDLMAHPEERRRLGETLHDLFPPNATQTYRNLILKRFSIPSDYVAHCVGIGGIGISSLAQYLAHRGYRITGSDLSSNEVTRRLEERGAEISYTHRAQNITDTTNLVIYSTAVATNNVELEEARKRKIPTFSYKEYLGRISNQYYTVAISGTHGKTTTTALTGYVLQEAQKDPTVIVGAFIPQFENNNIRLGKSDTLVVEADEYRSDMLHINPSAILLTNIDFDHTDFYRDIQEVQKAFQQFVVKLPAHGVLIKNVDDPRTASLQGPHTLTVGMGEGADYRAILDRVAEGRQYFTIVHRGTSLAATSLQIPGLFNVSNALAAFAFSHYHGIEPSVAARAIADFRGSWRRFEKVGSVEGALVYSDYAHHPTAISKTIDGFKSFYPDRKLVVLFQPHSYARTHALQADFVNAFHEADTLILTEIYDVAGRDVQKNITGRDLFEKIAHRDKHFTPTQEEARAKLGEYANSSTLLVVMGAGDIDTIARTIVE